jgi:excisionase family DNA binding protein
MALITLKQAADRLGLKLSTLRFWVWTRRIDFVKVGRSIRVKESTVDTLIEAGTVPARRIRRRLTDGR